ncbi:MAG: disulfide bond formation protein DsbA [Flavipsychrobacter sp.]|nr:disulfide bond formation protein DsbA [Flavipsychrobacter sp.]
MKNSMTIDIWSDIMCPFCYIGKRKLENALEQFPQKDKINIVWHSFQLNPGVDYPPGTDIYNYLAERKGQTRAWAEKMYAQVTESARQEGLTYNFDKAVIANSFDAHRLIQMAKTKGLGDAAKERLLKAYFTDGLNISNRNTLIELGAEIGLDATEVGQMLDSNFFAAQVEEDIERAQAYGINGVPFFVLNNKYGISGAQPSEVFLSGLQQAWGEYQAEQPLKDIGAQDGAACTPDGDCN